jgi:hypothetical protein
MLRKIALIFSVLVFALGILFTSVLRTAAVKYEFSDMPQKDFGNKYSVLGEKDLNIDYDLAYPGKILPDNPLWPVKAFRDRAWLWITTNESRKAELQLLFADKRIAMSKILFEKGKTEVAYSTLTKAEKYLEEASKEEIENRKKGIDTSEFLMRLANASLKHIETIDEITEIASEDAKPSVIATKEYPKKVFEETRNSLLEKGIVPPENPFDWN